MALVAPEAPSEQARRVFQTYDPEGKRFYFLLTLTLCFISSYVWNILILPWVLFLKSYGIIERNVACISWKF